MGFNLEYLNSVVFFFVFLSFGHVFPFIGISLYFYRILRRKFNLISMSLVCMFGGSPCALHFLKELFPIYIIKIRSFVEIQQKNMKKNLKIN